MREVNLLSGHAARWTDQLILKGSQTKFSAPYRLFAARLVSCVVFPIFAGMDAAYRASKASIEWTWSKGVAKDDLKLAAKCFVGAATSPLGILSPDLVTFHHLPAHNKTAEAQSFGGLYASKSTVVCPSTLEELQAIVRDARLSGRKIAVAGAQFSQGKQFLPPGEGNIIIDMKRFNSIGFNDASPAEAAVGAGATWQELQRAANQVGKSVSVMQASNVFSIGGSISVNCHGWDHRGGAIGNTISSLTIVNADGNLQVLRPDDELFRCVVGGFGGFGIIVEATLSLAPNDTLQRKGEEVDVSGYVDYFNRHVLANDDVLMHRYLLPLDPKKWSKGIAINFHKDPTADIAQAPLVDEPARGSLRDRVLMHLGRRSGSIRKIAWKVLRKMYLKPEVESRNACMRPPINALLNESVSTKEWLQEYFVTAEELPGFLSYLGDKLADNNVKLSNASVRYIKADTSSELSYAEGQARFSVVICFTQSLGTREVEKTRGWVGDVIERLARTGGSFYLPYMHFSSKEQFRACYPSWRSFAEKKENADPDSLFMNGLYEDYLLAS